MQQLSFLQKSYRKLNLLLGIIILGISACNGGPDKNWEYTDDLYDDTGDALSIPEWDDEATARSISHTYHLPFHSGENFLASTYSGHGDAWDFSEYDSRGRVVCGAAVTAITNGKVVKVVNTHDRNGPRGSFGNYVRIDHDADGYYSVYAHLHTVYVKPGQWVEQGQALGTVGNTGQSTNCHIHLQVENSGGTKYLPKFYHISGGKKASSYLSHGKKYTSHNHGKISSMRKGLGRKKVGTATSKTASKVAAEGYAKYFTGGTWGNNAIYYQATGCDGGDFCPSYNNTNVAYQVRHGFYNDYSHCGGPAYCWLGFPTGNEYWTGSHSRQNFEHGYLLYSRSRGVTRHRY